MRSALLVLAVLAVPDLAHACSVCALGDPTLTTMGLGQPSAHRLRISLGETWRTVHLAGAEVDEHRLSLGVAYAPTARWMLAVRMPLAHQRLRYSNLAERRRWSVGDVSLEARATVFRDRAFAPEHLLFVRMGLAAPTGSARDEADLGAGGFTPRAGLAYALFRPPWSASVAASISVPLSDEPMQAELEASAQYQPFTAFGFRVGADMHHDHGLDIDAYGGFVARAGDLVFAALVGYPLYTREGAGVVGRLELTLDV